VSSLTRIFAVTACGLLLAGCSSGAQNAAERHSRSSTLRPSAVPTPTPTPKAVLVADHVRAGALADRIVRESQRHVAVDVAFGGIVVGQTSRWESVVYPWLHLTAGNGVAFGHVKLPYFRCPLGADPRSVPRSDCTDRYVHYADASIRGLSVSVATDDVVTIRMVGREYRYGTGVDRSAGLRATMSGGPVTLRFTVRPGAVTDQDKGTITWRPLATVAVSGGQGSAPEDEGYDNVYTLTAHG
jgi:hypothetical protein